MFQNTGAPVSRQDKDIPGLSEIEPFSFRTSRQLKTDLSLKFSTSLGIMQFALWLENRSLAMLFYFIGIRYSI